MQLETLQRYIKVAMREDFPAPRYPDFLPVRGRYGNGMIVGRHWLCLLSAWEERALPGWHYTVTDGNGQSSHTILHESEVKPFDAEEADHGQ